MITSDQVIDTVDEFLVENPEFDTFYDDNVGFQQWKRNAENIIGFCTTKKQAYKKLEKFMFDAQTLAWEPRR